VDNLGKRGEVVKVARDTRATTCCAQLRAPVNDGNRKLIERERKLADARRPRIAPRPGTGRPHRAARLTIARRVGNRAALWLGDVGGPRRGAVGARLDVDRRKIQLAEPLKALGEATVPIKLHRDVTAQLKVTVARA
jgi:large subunit ribosomal protein L9